MSPVEAPAKARLLDVATAVAPAAAALIFISAFVGSPPMWSAWLIAVAPWLFCLALSGQLSGRTPFDLAIAIFVAGVVVGFWVSPDMKVASEGLQTTVACIMVYYGLVNNGDKRRGYWLAVAGIVGLIILGFVVWYFSQGVGRHLLHNEWLFRLTAALPKTTGPAIQIHALGMLLAVSIPVVAAVAVHHGGRAVRLVAVAGAFLMLALLFLVASGAGLIAVAFGLAFVIVSWRWWILGAVVPAMGGAALLIGLNYHKFTWATQVFSVPSLQARERFWLGTLHLFKDSPITGITGLGLGNWNAITHRIYKYGAINAHNSYLQLYSDTGVLGLVAAAVACVVFVKISWRIVSGSKGRNGWHPIAVGAVGAIIAGAVGSMVEVIITGAFHTTRYHYLGIPLLWMLAALLVVSYRRSNETPL